jgi:choline dehydrogenase-like flavoprotein
LTAVPRLQAVDRLPTRTDVLIVGSGAGGSPTAAVLAEAGLDVLVVEEGDLVRQGDVVPFSLEQMDRQYRAGGVTAAVGRPALAYAEGCCAGGGTEINSGLYRRPPEEVLERWRTAYRLDDLDTGELYAICEEVESELTVQPLTRPPIAPSELLRRGAERLGWEHGEIPRWMEYAGAAGSGGPLRRSMTETYLPRAAAAGAILAVGQRVDRLVVDRRADGAVATAAIVTGRDGTTTEVRCADVFVCAGAIQTPALLQRSGLGRRRAALLAAHPTVKLAARFDADVNVADEVPVHQVTEFAPDLSFGGSASSPGLVALALSDNWSRFGEAVESWQQMAVYYAAITSEGRGRVVAVPGWRDPIVTYRLTRRDRALLGRGLARLALVLLEAGATAVYPSYRGAPIVRGRRDLAVLQGTFTASQASLMTVHLCSTAPMGGDPRRSATDSDGRVRGTSNVFVNDASLLPDAPGVNPQGSVMAVAIRNARRFLDTKMRSPATQAVAGRSSAGASSLAPKDDASP